MRTKRAFLRSNRSLTQTIGRAARHINGIAILYADKITDSMRKTMDETNRRRAKQIAYNEEHGITPTAIHKAIDSNLRYVKGDRYKTKDEEMSLGVAADPVVKYMTRRTARKGSCTNQKANGKSS